MSNKVNIIDLGKVAITISETPWNAATSYERMTMVYHKQSGDCFISLKDNFGVNPVNDATRTWVKVSEHGHSIYEIAVEQGKFVGTEEQFAKQYADAIANMQATVNEWNNVTKPIINEAVDSAKQATINADIATAFANEQGNRAKEIADLANPVLENLEEILATALAALASATNAQTSALNASDFAQLASASATSASQSLQNIYDKIDEVGETDVAIATLQEEKFDKADVAQETGDAEDKVMSQKAFTDFMHNNVLDTPFEQGSISTQGIYLSSDTRLRTTDKYYKSRYFITPENTNIVIYTVVYFKESDNSFDSIIIVNDKLKQVNEKDGCYYKVVLRRDDDTTLRPSDVKNAIYLHLDSKVDKEDVVNEFGLSLSRVLSQNALSAFKGEIISVLPKTGDAVFIECGDWIDGEYYDVLGVAQQTGTFSRLEPIDISEYRGRTLILNTFTGNGYCLIKDSEDNILLKYTNNYTPLIVSVPEKAALLYVSNRHATLSNEFVYVKVSNLLEVPTMSYVQEHIKFSKSDLLLKGFKELNLEWTKGEYYKGVSIETSGNWERAMLDVSEFVGSQIAFLTKTPMQGYNIYMLVIINDSNEIMYVGTKSDYSNQDITFINVIIPEGAKYVLLNNRWATFDNPSLLINDEALSQADKFTYESIVDENAWQNGFYRYGNLYEHLTWKALPSIDISKYRGTFLKCFGNTTTDTRNTDTGIFVKDSVGNITQRITLTDGAFYIYVGPTDKYICICNNTQLTKDPYYKAVSFAGKEVHKSVSDVEKSLPYTFVVPNLTWIKGEYYDSDGNVKTTSTWERTELDISEYVGLTLTVRACSNSTGVNSLILDEDGTIIYRISPSNYGEYAVDIAIPSSAKTLLLNNRWATFDNPSVSIRDENKQLLGSKQSRNNLKGKTVVFLGDSITAGGNYHTYFSNLYGCTKRNLGVYSTCIASNTSNNLNDSRFITRVTQENFEGASLIVVFGGTNDFSYDIKPIGSLFLEDDITPSDRIGSKKLVPTTDKETFDGALHELILKIREVAPGVPIVFMTPLTRGRYASGRPTSVEQNINGNYLSDFCDTIKKICAFYSIPVLDLNTMSNIDLMDTYTQQTLSSDTLHPNTEGHKLLGNLLWRFVEDNVVIL